MCVFVWNLISAPGPMALVCLHPKSKLCNYDDRPVLFISHLCLCESQTLTLPPSLSLFFSPSDMSESPLEGKGIINSKTVTGLIKLLALCLCVNSHSHSSVTSPSNVLLLKNVDIFWGKNVSVAKNGLSDKDFCVFV